MSSGITDFLQRLTAPIGFPVETDVNKKINISSLQKTAPIGFPVETDVNKKINISSLQKISDA